MITISLVTITYNAEKVLKPTLDSVLAQQYGQREYKESEMQEILGVDDLFKEKADGQKDS